MDQFGFSFSCRDTYIERKKDESSNDRNDRAIRVACRCVQTFAGSVVIGMLIGVCV